MNLEFELAFKDFVYEDTKHEYYHKHEKLTSVTTFLSSLTKPFDKLFWSTYKAFERSGYKPQKYTESSFRIGADVIIPGQTNLRNFNLTVLPEDILTEWDHLKTVGIRKGQYVHDQIENLNKRDITVINQANYGDPMLMTKYLLHVNNFKRENENLIPILNEYVVGDSTLKLGGRFDTLYYNISTCKYHIYDYKTDKKIDYTNRYGEKFDMFNIDVCEFNKYSLQTSLYRYIIERNVDVELGESFIVHFTELGYSIIQANDYTQLIADNVNNISTYLEHKRSNRKVYKNT